MRIDPQTDPQIDLPVHLQALTEPENYPHPVDSVEMLQTHASWVMLAGEFAYKFKKPVDFGFMDFSTLEKRRFFCHRELELNRRLAPSLYLEVLPVCQQGRQFNLIGSGTVIDYCLKMARFDQDALFDHQLEQGTFNPLWMDQLAKTVARFHASSETAGENSDHAHQLASHLQDNLAVARAHIGLTIEARQLKSLSQWIESELKNAAPLLAERLEAGHIRRCHGDMHLRNIVLIDGTPTLFDCIEFSDAYSMIDTMNDIAFLVMDCDARNQPYPGMRFLSRYLEQSGDYSGLALLPLYLLYRATVRGKVAAILADELPETAASSQWQEAHHYFDLAWGYSREHAPNLFAIGGLSGSGKSHLARKGCGIERAIIIRSDATRKRIASDHPDLPLYGSAMHRLTYKAMFDAARQSLEAGWSVILDATFLHPDSRSSVAQLAVGCGLPLHFFWLDLPETELRQRIRQRICDGRDISDADLAVLDLQLAEFRRPQEPWITFLNSSEHWPRQDEC